MSPLLPLLACLLTAPEPALQLTFDGPLPEFADIVDHAPAEGPAFQPGPWGDALDLSAASRFGGWADDTGPAGGAVVVRDERLPGEGPFTVTVWAAPAAGDPAINARLLNKVGSWEVTYGGSYQVLLSHGERKVGYRVPSLPGEAATSPMPGAWAFLAVTVDPAAQVVRTQAGDLTGGLSAPVETPLEAAVSAGTPTLQVGNYEDIRPFRGRIDGLRLFDRALTPEEVAELHAADVAQAGPDGARLTPLPPLPARRFDPPKSAVFFSTRWQSREPETALALLPQYHVSYLIWVYGDQPAFIEKVHDLGIWYQGTLNGLQGYQKSNPEPSGEGDDTGRQQDYDGNKVILPWMRTWSPKQPLYAGNHASDDFRRLFFEDLDVLIDAGIDGLHIDDWEMTVPNAAYGRSGFSPATQALFRDWMKTHLTDVQRAELGIGDLDAFDYRAWLRERHSIDSREVYEAKARSVPTTPLLVEALTVSLRDFYAELRDHLDARSPDEYLPVSVNNQFYRRSPDWGLGGMNIVDRVDFFIGETSERDQHPVGFIQPCLAAEALGIPQVMMTKTHALGLGRAGVATSYALGQWGRVPWDVFMGNNPDGSPAARYYGETADWKPLFDFVHDNAARLDGYRTAATVAVLFNADEPVHGPLSALCERLARERVPFALVGAAARHARVPLSRERLEAAGCVIALSPDETFSAEDQAVLAEVRAGRRVRFLAPEQASAPRLESLGRLPIRVEGPERVYVFPRVHPDTGALALHVVNWSTTPAGETDPYEHVALSLDARAWRKLGSVTYHQPGVPAQTLEPERHHDRIRILLPRIETWGLVSLER